jgi:hypothetical protein
VKAVIVSSIAAIQAMIFIELIIDMSAAGLQAELIKQRERKYGNLDLIVRVWENDKTAKQGRIKFFFHSGALV